MMMMMMGKMYEATAVVKSKKDTAASDLWSRAVSVGSYSNYAGAASAQ